jgi:hypothetical protein
MGSAEAGCACAGWQGEKRVENIFPNVNVKFY